jgi:hypothetical protein
MAIEAGGMRQRAERLKELAGKLLAEARRASEAATLLTMGESGAYVQGVREAAEGLERARLVLTDALARVEAGR